MIRQKKGKPRWKPLTYSTPQKLSIVCKTMPQGSTIRVPDTSILSFRTN